MKIFIALALALPLLAWQSALKLNLDHLAAKATEKVDVTLDGSMLKMASGFLGEKGDENKAKKLVSGLQGVYVKSFKFDKDGQYTAADVESVRSQLQAPVWSRVVNIVEDKKDRRESVEIYIRNDGKKGFALIAAEPRELTVVNIEGDIDLAQLKDLGGSFGVPKKVLEAKPPKPPQ